LPRSARTELFQYLNEQGRPATNASVDVSDYTREVAGQDFTAEDFRTWAGTVLAAPALRELVGTARREAPRRPTNKDVVRAIARVAERLGNTLSICGKCYVHPEVIGSYMDGTLVSSMTKATSAARAASPACAPTRLRCWRCCGAVPRRRRTRRAAAIAGWNDSSGGRCLLAEELRPRRRPRRARSWRCRRTAKGS
jgi:DNA topoisomerase IB